MNLHSAYARSLVRGEDLDFFFLPYLPGNQRAGHNRTEAFHNEDAVDGQPEQRLTIARRDIRSEPRDLVLQSIEPRAFESTHGNDRRAAGVEERSAHKILDLQPNHIQRIFVDQVSLGDHGDPARDGEQPANLEVLASLRLDGFIGGHDQEHQVHAAHAGQHVAHKTLMIGNLNDAQAQHLASYCRRVELQMSKAQIDGDPAPRFFFQTVSVDPSQSFHQRGLAVIDVSGRADDDGFHAALSVTNCQLSRAGRWSIIKIIYRPFFW